MIPLGNCEENSNASTAEFAWSLPQGKEQTHLSFLGSIHDNCRKQAIAQV
jgi:hypothetical protein